MAFSLTKTATRSAVRSSAPARRVQAVRCQAMPDFKGPMRTAAAAALAAAVSLTLTMSAGANEQLQNQAKNAASELGAKTQNAASKLQSTVSLGGAKAKTATSSNPLDKAAGKAQEATSAIGSKIGNPLAGVSNPLSGVSNPLAGAGDKLKSATQSLPSLSDPLSAGSDAVQNVADNIVAGTPFEGTKVSKSVPIERSAIGPDPARKVKYT